jgi:methyl-accepting chemotaxis protein
MRLRAQLILLAVCTAGLCGGLGGGLIWRNLNASAETMLNGELQIGEAALLRQWTLSRSERQRAYESIARQPYLRAYLAAKDAAQMSYFATALLSAGADAAAIVDRSGHALATEGPAAEALVERARKKTLERTGTLLQVNGSLMTVYRIPVGGEIPIGSILVCNRFEVAQLRADTSALGLQAAVAAENVVVSSLGERELTTADFDSPLGRAQLAALAVRYYVRILPFGDGKLALAMPRERVRVLTTTFPRQLLGLILLIVTATAVVALVVLSRITGPIERLQGAVGKLGLGRILESQRILRRFPRREDEIGSLAREFNASIRRIKTIVVQCQKLSGHLSLMAEALDQTAATMANDAARQGFRLTQVTASFGPMATALQQTSDSIGDLTRLAASVARSVRHIEQEATGLAGLARRTNDRVSTGEGSTGSAIRAAGIAQQVSTLAKDSGDILSEIIPMRMHINQMVHTCTNALQVQIHEQHQGEFVLRAIAEIDRLAKAHTKQAAELQLTAETLRSELGRLNDVLALFDTGTLVGEQDPGESSSHLPAKLNRLASAVLALVTLASVGCAPPAVSSTALSAEVAATKGTCGPLPGEGPVETLPQLMTVRINPRLSRLSMLLFHDRRPEDSDSRNDEVGQLGASLADCFALTPTLRRAPAASESDFSLFAATERFNANSLSHAGYQGDHNTQVHWFMHIKEVCQACHAQYRFASPTSHPSGD